MIETTRWIRRHLGHATRMVLRNLERQPVRAFASSLGIAFGGAVLFVGFGFIDSIDVIIDRQFEQGMRQDATVTFVEPTSGRAIYDATAWPGVFRVEPQRTVHVRLRAGQRSRTLAITGTEASPELSRVIDIQGRPHTLPPSGLTLSRVLANVLHVAEGDAVQVEVLEGWRPIREIEVAGIVDDMLGVQAYMEIGELRRLMREGPTVSALHLQVDPAAIDTLYDALKTTPAVAGVTLRDAAIRSFREVSAQNTRITIGINVIFAGIIAFGVVYNAARISLSERSRELASLRVLGFTRGEISSILLGELAVLTLMALPLGTAIGYGLGLLITTSFTSEVYRIPFVVTAATVAWVWLTLIAAATGSALLVRRQLDHLDLVAVLKTRE